MPDGLTVHTYVPEAALGDDGSADLTGSAFYYDFVVPDCYLMAERVLGDLPVVPEWMPVALGEPPAEFDRSAFGDRIAQQHLQPLRWPAPWPWDPKPALLAATYAKSIGRAVPFSLAAFRQAYAGGRDLSDTDTVLIAAAANEMHPRAVLKALELRSVATALSSATENARAIGVSQLPALRVGSAIFTGPDAIEAAGAAMLEQGSA